MRARLFALLSLFLPLTLLAADGATTVLIVRHAEAVQDGSPDPGLTVAGTARAKALAKVAQDARVDAVFTTDRRRTKDTAAEIDAPKHAIEIDRAKLAEQHEALAKRIAEQHRGETVLVVGHSNTVPMLVKALAGVTIPAIEHTEHDRLYVIVLEAGRAARVVAARY